MYIFTKIHRIIFVIILLSFFAFSACAEDRLLGEKSCVHKKIKATCVSVIVEDKLYILVMHKSEFIAVFSVVGEDIILIWEKGVQI